MASGSFAQLSLFLMWTITLVNCNTSTHSFDEEVQIQPLPNKLVHTRFMFMTRVPSDTVTEGHYQLFPKALGEILEKYSVQELDLSLTQGNWRYSQWGIPSEGTANPSGASILAIFKSTTDNVDMQWKGLVNALSGLICASLNFVDKTVTTTPMYTFYPRGAFPVDEQFNQSFLRYANLPQENVCTENLTPWKKLLPCVGKAGLASLLASKPLFDSHYHSMSISVRPQCKSEDCKDIDLTLTQALSVVLNHAKTDDFSISSLFGKVVARQCYVARRSEVIFKFPSDGALALNLNPQTGITKQTNRLTTTRYETSLDFNVKASYKKRTSYSKPLPPVIHSQRYLTGYGQEYGSIVCEITNNEAENIQIVYTEYVPWFLRVYLHTLKVESEGTTIKPAKISYSPGLERAKPYMFELLLNIPANATTLLRFDIEKLFLKWTEYPPDANLGFYIPSAIITAVLPDAPEDASIQTMREGYGVVRLYTEKLLVLLPTPDFSMPFNVICLACTVVALAFGSMHNLTTQVLVRKSEQEPSKISKIITKIKKALGMKTEDVPEKPVTKPEGTAGDGNKESVGEAAPDKPSNSSENPAGGDESTEVEPEKDEKKKDD